MKLLITTCTLFSLFTSSSFALSLKSLGQIDHESSYKEAMNQKIKKEQKKNELVKLKQEYKKQVRTEYGQRNKYHHNNSWKLQSADQRPIKFNSESQSWNPAY